MNYQANLQQELLNTKNEIASKKREIEKLQKQLETAMSGLQYDVHNEKLKSKLLHIAGRNESIDEAIQAALKDKQSAKVVPSRFS